MSPAPRVLLLDNRDSFVFNLADEFLTLGADVLTVRSGLSLHSLQSRLQGFRPDLVILSPGPGHPADQNVMVPWLRTRPRVPVFGVCLGHQAMVVAAGGEVGPAPRPVHGRASEIKLAADPLFDSLPCPFLAARYHSLVATVMPPELLTIATIRDEDRELVMALRHRSLPWIGVQFHPESILTAHGSALLARILEEVLKPKESGQK
jgi:anthranilate synthase component 2